MIPLQRVINYNCTWWQAHIRHQNSFHRGSRRWLHLCKIWQSVSSVVFTNLQSWCLHPASFWLPITTPKILTSAPNRDVNTLVCPCSTPDQRRAGVVADPDMFELIQYFPLDIKWGTHQCDTDRFLWIMFR